MGATTTRVDLAVREVDARRLKDKLKAGLVKPIEATTT